MTLQRLETSIDSGIDNALKDLNTSLPGKIISFSPSTQLASVQLQINRVFSNDRTVEIPKLINVPVVFLRGGGFSITFPVKPDDECLVIFSQRSIDKWVSTGQASAPAHNRMHDFSDGIALVGLSSQPNKINNFDSDNFQIRNDDGTCSISIEGDGTINIGNPQATLKLYPNGKIDIKNQSSGFNLFNILSTLLATLAADGVEHDGFHPLLGQSTYATLKSQLDTFIP